MLPRLRRNPVFAVPFLTLLCLVPPGAAGAKETVALNFDWPVGLQGNVTFESRSTRTSNGESEDINMVGRYEFTTSPATDGILIEFDNVQTEVENSGSGPQALVKKYMAKAASVPPSYVISADGQFLRVEGLERFQRNMLDGINDAFSQFPAQTREQVMQVMSTIFTKEQVEASITSEWNMAVGAWLGAELDEGDVYELTYNEAIPAFGNMEVPMRATFQFKARVPCNGDASSRRCVELEMRTFVDPEGLAAAVEAFLARIPSGQTAPRIEALQQETVVRLISDPDTLIPHLLESSKRTATTVSLGDQTQAANRIEENRFVYTY